MEPRLSSKWLINVAWMGSIISLPIPSSSFFLSTTDRIVSTTSQASSRREYNPTPPPLAVILSNILPSLWSKTLITKGLQNASPLVQRATALCLAQALEKYDLVLRALKQVEDVLEEEEGEGRWKTRRQEVEREIKRKVPNFEVIVAFSQVKSTVDSSTSQWGITDLAESDKVLKNAMLAECALRLMWLYHRSLPEMPAEARYDAGKLLLSGSGRRLVDSLSQNTAPVPETKEAPHDVAGFDALSQLHVLRLLQHSDQFIWHATLGASPLRFCGEGR
jgi:nucleolar pre-ribosomal-associated protein 1